MFNNSMQGVSVLSFALMASVKDCLKNNTFEEIQKDGISFFNGNGDIYLPLATKDFEVPSFDPPAPYDEKPKFVSFDRFRTQNISNKITTIAFDETISLPDLLAKLAEEPSIYGVVLEKKKRRAPTLNKFLFNPLHPLNTFLIASGIIEIPKEGKLHVFEWEADALQQLKDETILDKFLSHYKNEYSELFKLAPHIIKGNIKRKSVASISERDLTSLIEFPFVENLFAQIEIEETMETEGNGAIKSFFIPTQLAIDGLVTPYYGLIYMEKDGGRSPGGFSLTPMYSGNINSFECGQTSYEANRDRYYESSGSNVCTGSYSNNTRTGWFTLSKVNLASMFFDGIVDINNAVFFAEASKRISGEIWKALNQENTESTVENKELEEDLS